MTNSESSNYQAEKKTLGRQKIEIKKIDNKNHRQVTFSKRRNGLIKKATELSILCGSQVAVIAFSPGEKLFVFGHPDADSIIDRYVAENPSDDEQVQEQCDTKLPKEGQKVVEDLNEEYEEARKRLEEEKRLVPMFNELEEESSGMFWWDRDDEANMELEELQYYRKALQELKNNVDIKVNGSLKMGADNLVPEMGASDSGMGFHGPDFGGGFADNDASNVGGGGGVSWNHQVFGDGYGLL